MFAIDKIVDAVKALKAPRESSDREESTHVFLKVISVTLCVAGGLVAYTCYKRKKFLDKYSTLPGPPVSFIFGNAASIHAKGFLNRHHVISEGFDKYGPIFGTLPPMWHRQRALIYCCEDFPFWRKHIDSDGALDSAGDNLIDLPICPEYIRRKAAVKPLISTKNYMERDMGPLGQLVDLMTHIWKNKKDSAFDVTHDFRLLFMDAICQTGFGINVGALAQANGVEDDTIDLRTDFDWSTWNDLVEVAMEKYQKTREFGDDFLMYEPMFGMKLRNAERSVMAVVRRIYERRRELDAEREEEEHNMWTTLSAFTGDLMMELHSMIIAGHEAIAMCASWVVYELARHPEIQTQLREKIRQVMPNGQSTPMTYQMALALEDVKKVMYEALRLHPVSLVIHHVLTKDIEVNGIKMYAQDGARFTNMKIIHDEKLWDKPLEFNPWRFDGKAPTKYGDAFHPFGGGKRKCLGYKYAELEIVILLTRILQRFHLELDESKPVWGVYHNTHGPRKSGVFVRARPIVEG